jgi:hypothetical protein
VRYYGISGANNTKREDRPHSTFRNVVNASRKLQPRRPHHHKVLHNFRTDPNPPPKTHNMEIVARRRPKIQDGKTGPNPQCQPSALDVGPRQSLAIATSIRMPID